MRIDWQAADPREPRTLPHGRVVDMDTMTPISGPDGLCCFVDEETGEWRRYAARDGKFQIGPNGRIVVETGFGRVKFFPFIGTAAEFEEFLRKIPR